MLVPIDKTDLIMLAIQNQNILTDFCADKRSPKTRHEYEKDLKDFLKTMTGDEPTPQRVAEFLLLDRFNALSLVLKYKIAMIERGLKESTCNRRLSAIKSFVNYANKIGKCSYVLTEIKSEKVKPYRDTRGITPDAFKSMLAVCDRETLKGKRD